MALRRRRLRTACFALVLAGCSGADGSQVGASATVTISTSPGEALRFEPATSSIMTTGAVEVTFHNRSSQAHNLVFVGGVEAATRTIVEAGGLDLVVVVPPGPGEYPFVCTIHPGMHGSLEIEAPNASSR